MRMRNSVNSRGVMPQIWPNLRALQAPTAHIACSDRRVAPIAALADHLAPAGHLRTGLAGLRKGISYGLRAFGKGPRVTGAGRSLHGRRDLPERGGAVRAG